MTKIGLPGILRINQSLGLVRSVLFKKYSFAAEAQLPVAKKFAYKRNEKNATNVVCNLPQMIFLKYVTPMVATCNLQRVSYVA